MQVNIVFTFQDTRYVTSRVKFSKNSQKGLLTPISYNARMSILFFSPSKNQSRPQLLEKARWRSRREASDQKYHVSLAVLCIVITLDTCIMLYKMLYTTDYVNKMTLTYP